MLPHTPLKNEDDKLLYPLVRIDTLDETYALPIREFFAKNGCRVITNEKTADEIVYWIIIGDQIFVKHILEQSHYTAKSSLIFCWDADELPLYKHINISLIAYVDPVPLSTSSLQTIMYHFFVKDEKTLHLQTSTPVKTAPPVIIQKASIVRIPNARETSRVDTGEADTKRIAQTIQHIFSKQPTKKIVGNKSRLFRGVVACCIFSLYILLSYPISLGVSAYAFQKTASGVQKGEGGGTDFWNSTANNALSYGKFISPIGSLPWIIIYGPKEIERQQTLIDTLDKTNIIIHDVVELIILAKNVATSSIPIAHLNATMPLPVAITQIKARVFPLQTNIDRLMLLGVSLKNDPPFAFVNRFSQPKIELGVNTLKHYGSLLTQVERLLLLYPYVAGFQEQQTILVLLQNNAELRPTGGFIGSLMKVNTNEGKIIDTIVEDVYAYDGQLKGHVDPPIPIREVLGQEHWYLRDSNWSPDFPTSAQKALWFFEKESGERMSTVASINADLFVSLLGATGPIDLPDINEQITESNFYVKALYYTQNNFFPGSTQKKDFLGQLIAGISQKLLQKQDAKTTMKIFTILMEAMANRNMQWYFTNPEAQRIVNQFRWSGAFPAVSACTNETENCVFLPLAVNEANLGVNKANILLTRKDRRTVAITDTEIKETIERTITHGGSGEPGSGEYKTYLRFYVPKNAKLVSFTADGIPIATKDQKALPSLPFGEIIEEQPFFTTVGTAQLIPEGGEKSIKLSFSLPLPEGIKRNTKTKIALFEQKQSGIAEVPTQVVLTVAAPFTIRIDDATLANGSYLEYNTNLARDDHTVVEIQQ